MLSKTMSSPLWARTSTPRSPASTSGPPPVWQGAPFRPTSSSAPRADAPASGPCHRRSSREPGCSAVSHDVAAVRAVGARVVGGLFCLHVGDRFPPSDDILVLVGSVIGNSIAAYNN